MCTSRKNRSDTAFDTIFVDSRSGQRAGPRYHHSYPLGMTACLTPHWGELLEVTTHQPEQILMSARTVRTYSKTPQYSPFALRSLSLRYTSNSKTLFFRCDYDLNFNNEATSAFLPRLRLEIFIKLFYLLVHFSSWWVTLPPWVKQIQPSNITQQNFESECMNFSIHIWSNNSEISTRYISHFSVLLAPYTAKNLLNTNEIRQKI